MSSLFSLNEAYYGKNLKLLAMEKEIQSLSDKMKNDRKIDPNKTEEVKRIELGLTKMFNLEKIHFSVKGEFNHMNAFTIPFFFIHSFDKKLLEMKETKDGIRYIKPDDKVLVLNINAYNLLNLTPSQNMAIILHEIGHNFFIQTQNIKVYEARNKITKFLKELSGIKKNKKDKDADAMSKTTIITIAYYVMKLFINLCIGIYASLYPKKFLKGFSDKIKKDFKKDKKRGKFSEKVDKSLMYLFGGTKIISKPFHVITAPIMMYLGKLTMKMDESGNYDAEKFSDTFASSYGYAKEVAEVFSKSLDKLSTSAMKNKYGYAIIEASLYSSAFAYFADPHPSRLYRVNFAKKKLEHELENNKQYLTAEQISSIKSQIKDIDNILKDNENLFLKVGEELNKRFDYDKEKDKAGSRVTDEEIMDFEKGVLKNLMQN